MDDAYDLDLDEDEDEDALSTAERAGIVDQQDAVLEEMARTAPHERDESAEPGGEVDPMAGEAPTG